LVRDRIIWISKDIPLHDATGEYIGLARVNSDEFKRLFRSIKTVMKRKGRGVFYEEAFQHLMDMGGEVTYEATRGLPWIEIDTVEDLRIAREKVYPRISRVRYFV
jgi:choline kinase